MGVRRSFWLGVVIVALPATAQESLRQSFKFPSDTLRASSLGFERVLNTFMWKNDLFYSDVIGPLEVDFRQRLRSRVIRSEQRSIQDELVDTLDVGLPLSETLKAKARLASSVLSDNRAVDLSKLAQHAGLMGIRYAPRPNVIVGAMAGYEMNAQQEERDDGFSYSAEGEAKNVMVEQFRTSVRSRWTQAFLSRRRPDAGALDVSLVREFAGHTRNTIAIGYNRQRREFYTVANADVRRTYQTQSNIFRRVSESVDISDQLDYVPTSDTKISLHGGILNRTIDRGLRYKVLSDLSGSPLDTRIQELQLMGSVSLTHRLTDWLQSETGLTYHEREERHSVKEDEGASFEVFQRQERSERRLDNIARRTSLATRMQSQPTEKDRLNFAGSATILRYDTPDTLNIDDRDELLITLGIEGVHEFSPDLTFSIAVDATLSHLVYLHRLQSANNNWNRILRFSPTVEYKPSDRFRSLNQAEVLANYTVYDFEEQAALTRSFSFRQASWIDSTIVQLTRRIRLEFVGGVRAYERGILLWSDFRERPQNYFVEQSYWPRVTYFLSHPMRLGVGYRLFLQDRYRYQEAERVFERSVQTSGPTVLLEWEGFDSKLVSLEGWRETQVQDGMVVRTISNLSLKVSMVL